MVNIKKNNLAYLKDKRKELRNNLTPAEAKLWSILKDKGLEGRKFRRQHSIENYILDFYCPAEKLAIELDGNHHFTNEYNEYEVIRTNRLEQLGIKVLRIENKQVFEQLELVIAEIKGNFQTTPAPTNLRRGAKEG